MYPEDYEIVWSGGPLLPPRRSKPPRWWTMGNRAVGSAEDQAADPNEAKRLKESMRPKRQYNRKKHGTVYHRPVDPTGQPEAAGNGDRGQPAEPLSAHATHQE